MAEIKVQYNCGCGFVTTEESKAVDHVDKTEHTISILGIITSNTK